MTDTITNRLRPVIRDGQGRTVAPTRAVNAGDASATGAAPASVPSLVRFAATAMERVGMAFRDRANCWNWLRQAWMFLGSYIEPLDREESASGTFTIDLRFSNIFELTLDGDTTIEFAAVPIPSGTACSAGATIVINNPSGYTLSWSDDVAPLDDVVTTVDAGMRAWFVAVTTDNGLTWDLMAAGTRVI